MESEPLCSDDPELFFSGQPADIASAQSICAVCPIQRSCLEGALRRGERFGVWGGEYFGSDNKRDHDVLVAVAMRHGL